MSGGRNGKEIQEREDSGNSPYQNMQAEKGMAACSEKATGEAGTQGSSNENPDKPIAPPEPREPAAREAVEAKAMEFIIERGWEDDNYGVARVAAEFALAYYAELRANLTEKEAEYESLRKAFYRMADEKDSQLAQWKTWGVVEVAVRNPQVADYCKHWEGRAEAAERSLLQARAELIPAVQSLLEWMPKYSIGSSGYMRQERVMKALLASTSAPEGTV